MSRTATNMGIAQTAAVLLVVGMMILGMPLAALAAGPATYGVDDGTHLTLWTRAATQARVDQLVQAYNASHKNHVDATYVVTDDYQTKVGAAAAANGLPDLFSADVVFMPNWTSAGLFTDITDRDQRDARHRQVAQAGIDVATWDGKKYGMPFIADLSVWMWNKKLFKQAGLDPDKGPASLEEFAADARAVAKLGGDSTAPSGAATAAAARCSPGSRSHGPMARHHERRRYRVDRQQRRVEVDLQDLPRHGCGRHGADARHQERDGPDLDGVLSQRASSASCRCRRSLLRWLTPASTTPISA